MKIQCPGCQYEADVPEDKVPAAGITASCPKCKNKFKVNRKDSPSTPTAKPDLYCPKCGHSQPKSDTCIKCGIVFSKFINAQTQKISKEDSKQPSAVLKTPSSPNPADESLELEPKKQPNPFKYNWAAPLNKTDKIILGVVGVLILLCLINADEPVVVSFPLWGMVSYYLYKKGMAKGVAFGAGFAILILLMVSFETATQGSKPPSTVKSEYKAPEAKSVAQVEREQLNKFISSLNIEIAAAIICSSYLTCPEIAGDDKGRVTKAIALFDDNKARVEKHILNFSSKGKMTQFIKSAEDVHAASSGVVATTRQLLSHGQKTNYEASKSAVLLLGKLIDSYVENVPMEKLMVPMDKSMHDVNLARATIPIGIKNCEEYRYSSEQAKIYKEAADEVRRDIDEFNKKYGKSR